MSLKHAILGFLEFGPKTGYDLKKTFDRSVAGFWPAQHSQIYSTLARLEQDGFVTMRVVPQTGKPDRKVYTITEKGRGEMHEWLLGSIPTVYPRSTFQVQLFFLGLLSKEEALGVLRTRLRCVHEAIAEFEGRIPEAAHADDPPEDRPLAFHTYLTLDFAIERAKFTRVWLIDLIAKVERGDPARGAPAAFEHEHRDPSTTE